MTTEPPKRRRWSQFRLRTLLIAILVLSVPLSWCAWRMERARRQREAVEMIERSGATFLYDEDTNTVCEVTFLNFHLTDADLKHLERLPSLRSIAVFGCDISDTGLEHLKGLTKLERLNLDCTHVSDSGLQHLEGLVNLRELHLNETRVTPRGVGKLQEVIPDCRVWYSSAR